jgi:hypothetical protein
MQTATHVCRGQAQHDESSGGPGAKMKPPPDVDEKTQMIRIAKR